jgi:hypothetical protein
VMMVLMRLALLIRWWGGGREDGLLLLLAVLMLWLWLWHPLAPFQAGEWEPANWLLEEMAELGLRPDRASYTMALQACGPQGRWEEVSRTTIVSPLSIPSVSPSWHVGGDWW